MPNYTNKLKEEIGRNYHSKDTDAIPFDFDNNIRVTTTATQDGEWAVHIDVISHPEYSVPEYRFNDELMAKHHAKQAVLAIKTKIKNENQIREFVRRTLENIL